MAFRLTSPVLQVGQPFPKKYTCDGDNISPPLTWADAPSNTQSFALILDDPDAPKGTFTHWVLYNLPGSLNQLPENFSNSSQDAMQGVNSYQHTAYDGPCPPAKATHTYHFRLYALDQRLDLTAHATRDRVLARMQGHVITDTELTSTYSRQEAKAAR